MKYSGLGSMVETKVVAHVRPPRVLLVEDNTLIALDLEEILKGYGCRVVGPSMTVREALEVLDREEVDIAVVDYLLEDGEAAPLARALDVKGIPYAICTGAGGAELCTRYPNTPILGKPYSPDDVSIVVNSLIASRLAAS
jgi:DNA-binding NtrC family response regulator